MFYLALIYYFIYTSTPGRHSPNIWHAQIHVSLFKCFEQTHESIFSVKSHFMQIRCHFHAIMLIYNHFAVFLKTIHMEKVHHRNLCKTENGDVRQRHHWTSYIFLIWSRIYEEHDLIIELRSVMWYKNATIIKPCLVHERLPEIGEIAP